jgi:hypothetical protein
LPTWWNWQTRQPEELVAQAMPVRVRPSAPEFDFQNRRMAMSIEAMTKIDNLKSWTSGVDVNWNP